MRSVNWGSAATISAFELRRRIRRLQENVWHLVGIGVLALIAIPFLAFATFAFFGFGAAIGTGTLDEPVDLLRLVLVYAWIGITLFAGYRAYAVALDPDRRAGMLTSVSHRELIGGLFLAECAVWGGLLSLLIVPAAVAFSLGTNALLPGLLLLFTSVILLTLALISGFIVALVVRNMGVRSVLLTRLRFALFIVLGLAYFGVIFTQAFETVFEPIYAVVAPSPIGWSADLVLVGIYHGASVSRAVGTLVFGSVAVVGGWFVMERLTRALWYADGVQVTHSYDADSRLHTRFERIFPRSMTSVVIADWTRARRAPVTLSFVLYPLAVLIGPVMASVQTGMIGTGLPLWVLVCGAWITGALFTLNVLGHEGAVLPITLLTDAPERALLGGHFIASILIGIPVALVATVGVAIVSPHGTETIVTLALSAILLSLVAPLVATGLGARFPRFDEVTVTRSTTAVVPSMFAFGFYSLLLGIVASPTVIGHSFLGSLIAEWSGVSIMTVQVAGMIASGGLGLSIGAISTWYARRRLLRFDLDR